MSESPIKTKILSKNDQIYFNKAVQCYFFFKQQINQAIESDLEAKLDEGSSIVYSLIKSYLEKEQFEVAFLQELNGLLKEIHEVNTSLKLSPLTIEPLQVGEIEMGEQVPIVFTDADTSEQLQIMYNFKEGICIWSLVEGN